MKILLLEDDAFINESIQDYFELNGHVVESYLNGVELLENVHGNEFDIFFLDINTPCKNGFEVLEELKKSAPHTPSIFITALSDIENIRHGFALGCNDYVKKPFELEELEIRALSLVSTDSSFVIKINEAYSFDTKHSQLLFNNTPVELHKNDTLILSLLVKNLGKTVPSEELIEYVWGFKNVASNTLRTQMKKLRTKLEINFISNVRGLGYKIDA